MLKSSTEGGQGVWEEAALEILGRASESSCATHMGEGEKEFSEDFLTLCSGARLQSDS